MRSLAVFDVSVRTAPLPSYQSLAQRASFFIRMYPRLRPTGRPTGIATKEQYITFNSKLLTGERLEKELRIRTNELDSVLGR